MRRSTANTTGAAAGAAAGARDAAVPVARDALGVGGWFWRACCDILRSQAAQWGPVQTPFGAKLPELLSCDVGACSRQMGHSLVSLVPGEAPVSLSEDMLLSASMTCSTDLIWFGWCCLGDAFLCVPRSLVDFCSPGKS